MIVCRHKKLRPTKKKNKIKCLSKEKLRQRRQRRDIIRLFILPGAFFPPPDLIGGLLFICAPEEPPLF